MAKKVIQAQMQQRRDTAANWAASNPVLLEGELGIVTDDPNLYKIGDGVTAWNDLKLRGFDGTLVQTTGDSENAAMSQKAVTSKLTELESEVAMPFDEWNHKKKYYNNVSVGTKIDLSPAGSASSYNSFCYFLGANDKAIIKDIQAGADTLYIYIVDANTNIVIQRLNEEGSVSSKSYEYVAEKPCYILGSSYNKGMVIIKSANAIATIREQTKSNEKNITILGEYEIQQAEYIAGKALISTGDLGGGGSWGTYYQIPMSVGDRLVINERNDLLAQGYSYLRVVDLNNNLIYTIHADGKMRQPSINYTCKSDCLISVCTQDKESVIFYTLNQDSLIKQQIEMMIESDKKNETLINDVRNFISCDFGEFKYPNKYYNIHQVGETINLEPQSSFANFNSFIFFLGANDLIKLNNIQTGADCLYIYVVDANTNQVIERLNEEGSTLRKSYVYKASVPCYILGTSYQSGSIDLINTNAATSLNNSINKIMGMDVIDISNYLNTGKALISTGVLGNGGSWNTYYQIPLKKGDRVVVEGGVGDVLASGYSYIQIYNEAGVRLSYIHANDSSRQPAVDYICKENCKVSICTTKVNSVRCYALKEDSYLALMSQGNNAQKFATNEFAAFLKFGVVGDSLSVGYMTNPITGAVNGRNIPYSWGQVLARKLGTTCLNFGRSGVTAKTWMSDGQCYAELAKDGNACECYVVGLGVNDNDTTIGNISDINWDNADLNGDTFYGNYGKVLQKIHSFAPNAIIFALTIPHTHINADSRNNAIREIVASQKIGPCFLVDLKEGYYDIFSTEIEKYYYDWHYSAAGYAAIADVMLVALSEAIRNNAGNKYIGSIGL